MTTMELAPTGDGTVAMVVPCGVTTGVETAGVEYTVAAAVFGGGGGGAETTCDSGSDAQPASNPIAPHAASNANDGSARPSLQVEIIVFILCRRLRNRHLV